MKLEVKQLLTDSEKYLGQIVEVDAWVRGKRSNNHIAFLEINDGTYFENLQVVFDENCKDFQLATTLTMYSSIRVTGELVRVEGKEQAYEIHAKELKVYNLADVNYPLQKKRHTFEYLRTLPHLRGRTNTFLAVFRVRSVLAHAIHTFFREEGFVYVHTPIITGIDAEGAGEMFRVTTLEQQAKADPSEDFFGKNTFLTVTGQLNVEPFAETFKKVYTFGPTFRSENSNTTRHASEFWMIEPEMCFIEFSDLMDFIERQIKFVIKYVLENAKEEMEFFDLRIEKGLIEKLNNIVNSKFARISYTEAMELLAKSGEEFVFKPFFGQEVQTEHEKYLAQHFGGPVFVTDYPMDFKAFYMKQNDDGKTVQACDLVVPGIGEIVGGSMREDSYDKLHSLMEKRGMKIEDYQWYLDMRKYGSTPHGGYGIGFERLLQYITGMSNIRDVLPYPRTPNNALM